MKIQRILITAMLATSIAVAAGCDDDEDEASPTATASAPEATEVVATPSEADLVITIDEPAEGAIVSVPFTASGTSNTFESALTVDLVTRDGAVLCRRHIMAPSGSGTPGTWDTTIGVPPPDTESTATLRAYELSAEDGSEINVVERAITASTEHPALYITSPACLATIAPASDLTVTGRGLVFEAAFILQLRDASGTAVAEQRGMAGGTEETDFTVTLSVPAGLVPGFYDLVVFNYSARDGAIENEFPVQVVVP